MNTLRYRPHRRVLRNHQLHCLVLLIALFTALAPTLSLLKSSAGSELPSLLDICSSDSSHRVDGVAPQGSEPNTPVSLARHCPLWLHMMDRLALPLAVLVGLTVRSDDSLVWPRPAIRPIVSQHLSTPPPRGPPTDH